jgi:hypothetical protein
MNARELNKYATFIRTVDRYELNWIQNTSALCMIFNCAPAYGLVCFGIIGGNPPFLLAAKVEIRPSGLPLLP